MADERDLPRDPDLEVDEDAAGTPLPVHLNPGSIAQVFAGGAIGVLARAALERRFPDGSGFPATTFAINIVGAIALAIVIEALATRGSDAKRRRVLRLLLGTGFLGGFTTYSALAMQTETFLRSGSMAIAASYAVGMVVVGFIASLTAIALTRKALAR